MIVAVFTNQATLSYSGGTVTSNIAIGEIVDVLSADKTAVTQDYTLGSEVTYAINIVNSGDTPFTGLTVTDDLGAYAFDGGTLQPLDYIEDSIKVFADGVLQPTPTVTVGPPLTVSALTVPANGVLTVLYAVRVNNFASPEAGGSITNTATVSGGTTDVEVSETVTAHTAAQLGITKSVTPAVVNENGELTYTFVIQNSGNEAADATDNAVITDTFDPVLQNLTVVYNGDTWTEGNEYTYDATTGQFTTAVGAVTVPVAAFAQDPATGEWTVTPGTATLTVTGTI